MGEVRRRAFGAEQARLACAPQGSKRFVRPAAARPMDICPGPGRRATACTVRHRRQPVTRGKPLCAKLSPLSRSWRASNRMLDLCMRTLVNRASASCARPSRRAPSAALHAASSATIAFTRVDERQPGSKCYSRMWRNALRAGVDFEAAKSAQQTLLGTLSDASPAPSTHPARVRPGGLTLAPRGRRVECRGQSASPPANDVGRR